MLRWSGAEPSTYALIAYVIVRAFELKHHVQKGSDTNPSIK
ncbi:hypothetical protein ACFL5H_02500 [Candidatus Latescibacterota bacterium]